ncbi:hypothetical protein [Simkania sp.]|uniref:hypothetical protein n=1 Tax=Simkania sp. TaxID=34094 RepID=UPI003B51F6A4
MTKKSQGILTGCDSHHEWMLKWWWNSYQKSNSYPVTFIDFGMTQGAKKWCETKGKVLALNINEAGAAPECASTFARIKRKTWLSKPQALLKTPYDETIWIDIDAEVKQSLTPLFNKCPENTFALCPELFFREEAEKSAGLIPKDAKSFNTGVIVYPANAPILSLWAEAAKQTTALGDQDLLSRLIFEKKVSVTLLPSAFNRIHPALGKSNDVIYHYASQMGQSTLLEKLKTEAIS